MPGFVKKVVRTEYIEIKRDERAGRSFGALLDEQIAKALHEADTVQEFQLLFEESEWHELQRLESDTKPYQPKKSKPAF